MAIDRRDFIKRALAGATLQLAVEISGGIFLLTPQQARAQGVALGQLSEREARTLEHLAEGLLPGATEAGVIHFIDNQLGVSADDCMLIAKYFEVTPPYAQFYRAGVNACDLLAKRRFKTEVHRLSPENLVEFLQVIGNPETPVEDGYPLSLFYLCLRSDAVDVVYGTPQGFEKLNVPYMAHIMPPEGWNV
ncbi:MAG: gluconate 2-dehydrogenase subunit 3 family protein [Pseudomonadales bacterium]|nr:gluconate 2-dehydrogenase subunit 3 family protein [Halioglobus sp.]MCP5193797.1 gluconate 2-dehydrogenase subunit 3 family protein [Pseudomonadales bacterium]